MKQATKTVIVSAGIIILSVCDVWSAIGQSAIITLSFPFGARAGALGETFTGIADNVDATFYNPASLGQSPLANSWVVHNPAPSVKYTAIAGRLKIGFGKKEKIWLGTDTQGLLVFNGKVWTTYDTYLIEEGDDLQDIAEKFLRSDDDKMIQNAVDKLKEVNKIGINRTHFIKKIITPHLLDSLKQSKDNNRVVEDIVNAIINLDESNQNATEIYGIIASKVDSASADSLSDALVNAFTIKDVVYSDLVEIKVPFNISIKGRVNALTIDESDRLWVGTPDGLWRYDGSSWNYYSVLDGLPSNNITCIATGERQSVAVGTSAGVGILKDGEWQQFGVEQGLPDSLVNAVAFGENNALYVGTPRGLVQKKDTAVTVFDTADGLLSSEVYALFFDSEKKLWIGGKDGVVVYDEVAWKRYKFPNSEVYCFTELKPGKIWIGTNKGAISYSAGKTRMDKDGKMMQQPPSWKPYHSKNALRGNVVQDITVHGKDVWLITEKAVNQYDRGDVQAALFYEPLLPAFDIPELWHANVAGVFPTEEWGTIGFYLNYLNFGENTQYDAQGRLVDKFQSYEFVLALCYGLPIKQDFSFGINIKYAHSALAPGIGEGSEGVGKTFAIDAAILKRNLLLKNLSLGFHLMNMGPSVFYISREEADPIPFTARLGLAYTAVQTPIHYLQLAVDLDREIVYNAPYQKPDPFWKAIYDELLNDKREHFKDELDQIIAHAGLEYWYVYFLALRMGMLYDEAGSRKELHLGLGLKYGNMGIDWFYIYSPRRSIARDGQWGFSFVYTL